MRTARVKAAKRRVPPLAHPGKGAFMSVEELWRDHMPDKGRNQVYALATSGLFPFLRRGRSIDLLRVPTLEILRGQRPPGEPRPHHPDGAAKKRGRKKKKAVRSKPVKSKPVARKGEVAPAPVPS